MPDRRPPRTNTAFPTPTPTPSRSLPRRASPAASGLTRRAISRVKNPFRLLACRSLPCSGRSAAPSTPSQAAMRGRNAGQKIKRHYGAKRQRNGGTGMTNTSKADIIKAPDPVRTVAPIKEETEMLRATDKITALTAAYHRRTPTRARVIPYRIKSAFWSSTQGSAASQPRVFRG